MLDHVSEACATLDPGLTADVFTGDLTADLRGVVLQGKEKLPSLIELRCASYTFHDLKKTVRRVWGDVVVWDARLKWTSEEQPKLQKTRARLRSFGHRAGESPDGTTRLSPGGRGSGTAEVPRLRVPVQRFEHLAALGGPLT